MELFDEINSLEYLYLTAIMEPCDNQLLITIKAATISEKEEYILIGESNIGPLKAISKADGEVYELYFASYAGYNVINESFGIYDESAERIGRLFCDFSKSSYLDYIRKTTFIEAIHEEEKLKHYAINCLNHTIDIATLDKPVITKK